MAIVHAPLTPTNHRVMVLPDGRRVILGSTAAVRHWNDGPPPHVGWWNCTIIGGMDRWRWWGGFVWSTFSLDSDSRKQAFFNAGRPCAVHISEHVQWSDYWPEGARVERIDPATGKVMPGLVPPMVTPYVSQAQIDRAFPMPATDRQFGEGEEVL